MAQREKKIAIHLIIKPFNTEQIYNFRFFFLFLFAALQITQQKKLIIIQRIKFTQIK